MDTVVIAAHPHLEHSRVNAHLLRRLAPLPELALRDVYSLYPDYLVDIGAEQQALAQAQLIVWMHPIQWYSMPPLMKLWLDDVFAFGWAYGPGGRALRGKRLWVVASTGGSAESYAPAGYNRLPLEAFLEPYRQTASLAGMEFLPPHVLHGAHRATQAQIEAHAEAMLERLAEYRRPGGSEAAGAAAEMAEVPAAERPPA